MPDFAEIFADHLHTVRFQDIPPHVVAATKRSILDTIGVILAGSRLTDDVAGIVRLVRQWGGAKQATVLGYNFLVPAPHAAFANGAMTHQFDFDDTHDEAVVHPTANSFPAALAIAESQGGRSGEDFLRAIALANDLVCRLGLAIKGDLYDYPWTRPPIVGIYGATAAASAMLGVPPEKIKWALGLTLHQTANTLECLHSPGSAVRGLRDGFSCRNGITAALMAEQGVHGDIFAFEGRFGLFNAYFRGEYDREVLVRSLGREYLGAAVTIKPWPSARETHASIQTVLEMRRSENFDPSQIDRVELKVGKTNLEFCEPGDDRRHPVTRIDALRSLPFLIACALCHDNVQPRAFSAEGLADPAVAALADKVTWELEENMGERGSIEPGHVRIRMRDGREFEHQAEHGPGHPDHPISQEMCEEKMRDCALSARMPLSLGQIEEISKIVNELESRSVDDLTRALTAGGEWGGA